MEWRMICRCASETPDWFLPVHHLCESLAYALAEVDGVVEVLEAGLARASLTAGYGERVSSSGPLHAPLPINENVFDAKRALHNWLMKTAVRLAETAGPVTVRSPQGLATYLMSNLDVLRRQDWVGALENELRALLKTGHTETNKQTGRVYAGQCAECSTDLYAAKGDTESRCAGCGTSYEVLTWRHLAKQFAYDHVGTPADLSRKLSAPQYGYTVTADQIRKWALREKIFRANPEADEQGNPIPPAYRLGDVLELKQARDKKYPLNGAA